MATMRLFNPAIFNPVEGGGFNTGIQAGPVVQDNYAIQHAIGPTTVKNSWIWQQIRLGELQREIRDHNFYIPKNIIRLFNEAMAKPEASLYDNTPILTSWFELGKITKKQYILLAAAEQQRIARGRSN